jgi:transcription factor IIIB subunit 2
VYELGATYLKLRSALNLDQILPEIDPAVYNIRFANRLDFGTQAQVVARDASRLIKRFKADWMTSGRRPAGICGACLVIAARMSDFLRTPEEVAQVVKVSPLTIKKRLMEFAQTAAANKTVDEWRALTDADLERTDESELPPVMKREKIKQEIAAAKLKLKQEREGTEAASERSTPSPSKPVPESASASASTPAGKRRRTDDDENAVADGALEEAAHELSAPPSDAAEDDDKDDDDMQPLSKEDYVNDVAVAGAGGGSKAAEAKAQRQREKRQFMASIKRAHAGDDDVDDDDDDELAALADDKGEGEEDPTSAVFGGFRSIPPPPDWSNKKAVYTYIEEHFFGDEDALYGGNKAALADRIDRWLQGRTAEEVIGEMRRVEWARHEREWFAKHHAESSFDDLDDEELDSYWVMDDEERNARARMWLSHNSKWLEEDRERQEKKAAYNRAHGIDPTKPRERKKRRNNKDARKGPFPSAREAIDSFATQKKFSSRINMDAIRRLGTSGANDVEFSDTASEYPGLQTMDDDKDDDGGKDDDIDFYGELEDSCSQLTCSRRKVRRQVRRRG